MEITHVESIDRARGTQIGVAYQLRWQLDGSLLRVEVEGEGTREVALGDCDFFDLGYSPFFNSLPVARDGLLEAGPARDYRMRFVTVPALTDSVVAQRYRPLGDGRVRYSSGSFEADIDFDADGFVALYHGFLERIA